MQDFGAAFAEAFALIIGFDAQLAEIIGLSLRVTLSAVTIACVIGLPLGRFWRWGVFPGAAFLWFWSALSWACRRWSSV